MIERTRHALKVCLFLFVCGIGAPAWCLPASPFVLLATRLPESGPPDSLPLCLPERVTDLLGVRVVAPRDADLVLEAVSELDSNDPEVRAALDLAQAILSAAKIPPDRGDREVEKALALSTRDAPGAQERACGWLERARLELAMRRTPEARVALEAARREFASAPDPVDLERAADYYSAELVYQTEDADTARQSFERLNAGSDAFGDAIRLRRAELAAVLDPSPVRIRAFGKAIQEVHGERGGGSGVRIAELAYRSGELDVAERWLHRVEIDRLRDRERAAVAIRRADVLVALRRRPEAGEILQGVATGELGTPAADLAGMRLIEHELVSLDDPVGQAMLERAERSSSPWVSRNARSVAAHVFLTQNRIEEALALLVKVSFDSPDRAITPTFFDDTRRVVHVLIGASGTGGVPCSELLIRLGPRRVTLLRHIDEHEPYAMLARCYAEVGLHGPALDTYRAMTRRFGPEATAAYAVEASRAYFLSGGRATARAAATAGAERDDSQRDAWRLLLAEIELAEGRYAAAADELAEIRLQEVRGTRFPRYLTALTRATSRAPRGALRRALFLALARPEARAASTFGEASLVAARLRRVGGDDALARVHYRDALAHLPDGPLKNRAAYWVAELAGEADGVGGAVAPEDSQRDPWAEILAAEREVEFLRSAVGTAEVR